MKYLKFLPVLLLALLVFLGCGSSQRSFTPERWTATEPDQRGKLVESLLEQYDRLQGMTRQEVEDLLGPDQEGEQSASYLLRVRGESMVDAGIFDGDLIFVREEQSAENGMTGEEIPVLVYPAGGRSFSSASEYLYVYLDGETVTGARLESE